MTLEIDALGKACPMPVVLTKQALDQGARDITVLVDNDIAVQNLTRLAESQGMTVDPLRKAAAFPSRISRRGRSAFSRSSGQMFHRTRRAHLFHQP